MSLAEIEALVTTLDDGDKLTLVDRICAMVHPEEGSEAQEDSTTLSLAAQRESEADEKGEWQDWEEFSVELRAR